MLKLFRNVKGLFLELMQCAYIDVDFSEDLTTGIKWEPQSMHWCKHQITIHSAILKYTASNSRIHDQVFVEQVLESIVADSNVPEGVSLVIESDNCSGQYKSTTFSSPPSLVKHMESYHLSFVWDCWPR